MEQRAGALIGDFNIFQSAALHVGSDTAVPEEVRRNVVNTAVGLKPAVDSLDELLRSYISIKAELEAAPDAETKTRTQEKLEVADRCAFPPGSRDLAPKVGRSSHHASRGIEMIDTIAMILRALGVTASMPELFGGKGEKLAPILATLASLAELPGETKGEQDALLALVNSWVREKRGPTTEELDTFRATRETNHLRLLELQGKLNL